MNSRHNHRKFLQLVFILACLAGFGINATAQTKPVYTIRNGGMYIELNSKLPLASLDSFVTFFNLRDIGLFQLILDRKQDSLRTAGWKIELEKNSYIITKPLFGFDNFSNPLEKIIFIGQYDMGDPLFPVVNNRIVFGSNRFKNKFPFQVKDSIVTFYLRNHAKARNVVLTGSFIKWNPNGVQMQKTDSGWIAHLQLRAGKYWYKFIVDGNWKYDEDNELRENDGRGNINSVYYKTNTHFVLPGFTTANRVYLAGSFNNWKQKDLQMVKTNDGCKLEAYVANETHQNK